MINRFEGNGVTSLNGANSRIEGNFIGTDPSGTLDRGNAEDGVDLLAVSTTVGGNTPAARNLISGNDSDGVEINGAGFPRFNKVFGNLVGTKKDGSTALGNSEDGV